MDKSPEKTAFPRFCKTRIAPTPSGYLHVGNVLSFAITAHLARKTGARILLRIDDLDRARLRSEYVGDIFESLRYLGIPWDEGPEDMREYEVKYSQLHRLQQYRAALEELKQAGRLYACDCPRNARIETHICPHTHIPFSSPGVNWRLHTYRDTPLTIRSLGQPPLATALPGDMQDFIVRKKDGFPAYQLASCVDDDYFGIDLVVRGADLWSSTLAQSYLSKLLGENTFGKSTCYHHPLLKDDRTALKLSKSAGVTSVHYLRHKGTRPPEIYGTIAKMAGCQEQPEDYQSLAALLLEKWGGLLSRTASV